MKQVDTTVDEYAYKGRLIALEGVQCAGKTTQGLLLKQRLEGLGHEVVLLDFPRHEEPSSFFVREYAVDRYGDKAEIGPYTSSLFYALDRYHAGQTIRQALERGAVVIVSRYTGNTMAEQGVKLLNASERRGFYVWIDSLEYEMLKIPRPDRSIVLRVPADIAKQLCDEKGEDRDSVTRSQLERSVEAFDEMVHLFPKDFDEITCIKKQRLLPSDIIHQHIWDTLKNSLPAVSKKTANSTQRASSQVNPYLSKSDNGNYEVTNAGIVYLESILTNPTGNVYAFKEKLNPLTIAAAMARLSRRGDDMRVTILDEFTQAAGKDEALLKRVITAYGDDSVQQLAGQHMVVENASNLLTKKLEWGRLAAYLEQSTRYIYFDQKNAAGKFKYYTPENLDKKTKESYEQHMNTIFELYSQMVRSLTDYIGKQSSVPQEDRDGAWKSAVRAQACDAIRTVLPVATQSTVGIFASAQALESLIMHLLSDELPEARQTGQQLLTEARKVIPTLLERADKPDRGGAAIAYRANKHAAVKELANTYLPEYYNDAGEAVVLTDFWPRNEIDIVADILYEHSSLPLQAIRAEVEQWDYDQKYDVFKAALGERLNRRHKPGRAFEKIHYSWDITCDYGIFRDVQRHRMVDDLNWQTLTPRYGYDVPEIVDEAGLTDAFQQCFDISLKLHSLLQGAGYELEAQYATLLGHKMRWKVTYNARAAFHIHELRTAPQGHPGYRKLVNQMHQTIAQVHPLVADAMMFVNKDEDKELTRLAAERYAQYKLKKLQ